MKQHDGYTSQDSKAHKAWVRIFCTSLPDLSCGMLLFQHHFEDTSPYFDHLEEANLGIVTGGSVESAIQRINLGGEQAPIPAAYRRLNRLLEHGDMTMVIQDTLAERGLLRAVAYTDERRKSEHSRLAMFDRAGFRSEKRGDRTVRILDLE